MKGNVEKTKKELKAERREKRKQEGGEEKVKKRKKGETKDVLEGVELPVGRKVARGWAGAETTSTSKKYAGRTSSTASAAKEDTKRECLFKTPLPPNKVSTKEDKKKDKGEKAEKKEKKRNKEIVVKEFKNNTKFPAFLKGSQLGESVAEEMASEYVDGVGWVNGRGEVVEGEKKKKRAADVMQTVKITGTVTAKTPDFTPKPVDKYKGTVSFEDADEEMVDVGSKKETASEYVSDDSNSGPESGAEPEDDAEDLPKTHKPFDSESSSEDSNESEPGGESEAEDPPTVTGETNPTPSSDSETSDGGSSKPDPKLKLSTKSPARTTSDSGSGSDSDSDLDSGSNSSDNEELDDSDSEPSAKPLTKTKPPQTTPRVPTPVSLPTRTATPSLKNSALKTSTPTLQITIPSLNPPSAKIHPLEALYKPTATSLSTGAAAFSAPSDSFKFGFGADDDDDDDDPEEVSPVVATPYGERYRSAAPTPDTAIGHRRFFPDENDHGARLAFVPSTPRVVGGGGPLSGQDLISRGTATTPAVESPLLFLHPESRFLGALSVWSQLPTPKAFVPDEPAVEEVGEKKDKKGKKGKRVAEEMEQEQGEKGKITPAEVWSERFYEKRGEWNRAWKGRRREALKAKRKREAGGKGGHA